MRVGQVGQAVGASWGLAGDVRIWQVDLSEANRVDGESEVLRRRRATRAALRTALSEWLECSPSEVSFVRGPYGKPALAGAGAGDVHFNVSRAGECCLIAITAIGPIGVDVERVVSFPEVEAIARTRFAPAEAAAILEHTGERRLRAFYNCWTRKEACLKATGAGLTRPLDAVTVTVDDARPSIVALDGDDARAWRLAAVRPDPDLIGAVAVRPDVPA
jgi:4'-phosphopantetheinyl transferase